MLTEMVYRATYCDSCSSKFAQIKIARRQKISFLFYAERIVNFDAIKPQARHLVYDLVAEAGVDVSDWKNYDRPENPASNPKYCYEWAFWDKENSKAALCLWFEEMKTDGDVIYQDLNYRMIAANTREWNGVQRNRTRQMDRVIQRARNKNLPIRVIVVDGKRRNLDDDETRSRVERRLLDPTPWFVARYDDDGNCRLQRGTGPFIGENHPPQKRVFLLTCNSNEISDSEITTIAQKLSVAKKVESRWSTGNRGDIQAGDEVFLLRQGADSPGLAGRGVVSRGSFQEAHWDESRRKDGHRANYVKVAWHEMVPKEARLPREDLFHHKVPESLLNTQSSGIIIPDEIFTIMEKLWATHYAQHQRHRIESVSPELPTLSESHKLARISYNSTEWRNPVGDASTLESSSTYNAQNKFGHEDWLFRSEWQIDGWRYAFIQGLNKGRQAYIGQPLNVTLYTLQPDKRRRLVATIYGLESLSDTQAKDALGIFEQNGWLKTMQDEVVTIGGNADALGAPQWAEHVLNVRFRLSNVDIYPPDTFLPDDDWIKDRHRYMLYNFEEPERERIEKSVPSRRGVQDMPEVRKLFRRGTKPVEYTPEHDKMLAKLMGELQMEFGSDYVWREKDFVDLRVEKDNNLIFFEIKTDLDPCTVIRQAIGQILEYAYHPIRSGPTPNRLVIVGRAELSPDDEIYLQRLVQKFGLPLSYRVVKA